MKNNNVYSPEMNDLYSPNAAIHRRFMKEQEAYLAKLKKMLEAKERGEEVDVTPVIKELQESGILDKNGKLSKHYR